MKRVKTLAKTLKGNEGDFVRIEETVVQDMRTGKFWRVIRHEEFGKVCPFYMGVMYISMDHPYFIYELAR